MVLKKVAENQEDSTILEIAKSSFKNAIFQTPGVPYCLLRREKKEKDRVKQQDK